MTQPETRGTQRHSAVGSKIPYGTDRTVLASRPVHHFYTDSGLHVCLSVVVYKTDCVFPEQTRQLSGRQLSVDLSLLGIFGISHGIGRPGGIRGEERA